MRRVRVQAADRAVARLARRIAAGLADVPGVAARVVPEGVAIEGRGLVRRILDEPRLRQVAWWLR